MPDLVDEIPDQRQRIRDLVALSAFPAASIGLGPRAIVENLANALLGALRPDLVYGGRPPPASG